MAFSDFLKQLAPIPFRGGFQRLVQRLLPWKRKSGLASGAPPAPPEPPSTTGAGLPNEDWLESGTWLYMASSNVHAIRYMHDTETLEVEFKSGHFYQYYGVDPKTASDFTTTASPGRFVWNRLRDRYPYARMTAFTPAKVAGKRKDWVNPPPRKPTVVRHPTPRELENKFTGPFPDAWKPDWMR